MPFFKGEYEGYDLSPFEAENLYEAREIFWDLILEDGDDVDANLLVVSELAGKPEEPPEQVDPPE